MPDQLIELNSLIKNSAQVWINPGADMEFGYSDGTDEEQYLVNVLNCATDLSVESVELAGAIQDWASEYHLSSSRSNLLSNIKFKENSKILELGCGCGAISRYLAEQGHYITAVEGSLKRAEIARLRNRELTNVEIVTHNFNSLELPQQTYDAVLFIGVLEYAKRFSDQQDVTAEQAVITLLNKAANALTADGLIIIAIENRTGLKYVQGGLEDHLAIPNVGLDDYIGYEFTGIKTYDYLQWQQLFSQCDLANRFYYPFPDYKLPDMVINGDLNQQDSDYLCTQIHTYDPISDWTMPQPENKKWNEIFQQSALNEQSNSFGIIASKSEESLIDVFQNRWCLNDASRIKPSHRVNLTTSQCNNTNNNKEIVRLFNNSLNINSKSLNNNWLEKFSKSPNLTTLVDLSQQLYQLIQDHCPSNMLVEIDQMLLSDENSVLQFGKHWQLQSQISAEQQLFHVLFNFCLESKKILSKADDFNFLNVGQIISNCFTAIGINYTAKKDEIIKFEQEFRNETQVIGGEVNHELLALISKYNQFNFGYINSQLFFANQKHQFNPENLITQRLKQTGDITTLCFKELNSSNRFLRLDPCDHEHGINHLFKIINIEVQNQQSDCIYKISIKNDVKTRELEVINSDKSIYKVIGVDPQIIFSLPADLKNTLASYNLLLKLQWLGQ